MRTRSRAWSQRLQSEAVQELLHEDPIVANIKDEDGLEAALRSDRQVLFLLYGSVLDIARTVTRAKEAGRVVFVNVDLIDGFSGRDVVVEWLVENTRLDGILSTKSSMIRAARRHGLCAVQRFFLVDSMSYGQLPRVVGQAQPDLLEILPGCVPRVLTWLKEDTEVPMIAGGLVCDRTDVMEALAAGAVAVASSSREVWEM